MQELPKSSRRFPQLIKALLIAIALFWAAFNLFKLGTEFNLLGLENTRTNNEGSIYMPNFVFNEKHINMKGLKRWRDVIASSLRRNEKDEIRIVFSEFAFASRERQKVLREEIYSTVWSPEFLFDDAEVVELCSFLRLSDYKSAEAIISRRNDIVDYQGRFGIRLLHWSIFLGAETFEFLLRNGASPNFKVDSLYDVYNMTSMDFNKSNRINSSFFRLLIYLATEEKFNSHHTEYFNNFVSISLKYNVDPNMKINVFTRYDVNDVTDRIPCLTGRACGLYGLYVEDYDNKRPFLSSSITCD